MSMEDEVVVEVFLSDLLRHLDGSSPFSCYVWAREGDPLTEAEVAEAIEQGKVNPDPYSGLPVGSEWSREQHIERVAYLVLNPSSDPIDVSVGGIGIPAMIQDGHHRWAAAKYRRDSKVLISIEGGLDFAESLFGIRMD